MNASGRRGHDYKIFVPRTRIDIRKRYFSVRVVEQWNALSEDTVKAESMDIFKRLLHRDLGQKLFDYLD